MAVERLGLERIEDFEASLLSDVELAHDDDESLRLADDDSISLASPSKLAAGQPPEAIAPENPADSSSASRNSPQPPTRLNRRWEGKRLSHFRLMRMLGSGFMGVVFQAEDVNLK